MKDLKNEVDLLKARLERQAYDRAKDDAGSWTTKTRSDVTALHRFFAQVAVAAIWVYANIIAPVAGLLRKPASWLFKQYRRLWDKVVYKTDKYQNRHFSKSRAGVMLLATVVFAWYIFLPLVYFVADAALYAVTVKHDEVVYFTNSQEILPLENVHSVQGCFQLPCRDEDSVYYRIRATPFNEVWSILNHHTLFYPDYVAAAVPLSISKCHITAYGFRFKVIVRGFDIYPDVLETECEPIVEKEQPK